MQTELDRSEVVRAALRSVSVAVEAEEIARSRGIGAPMLNILILWLGAITGSHRALLSSLDQLTPAIS